MHRGRGECDADLVIDMQEAGVGVEEILQYARGTFGDAELRNLIGGLQQFLETEPEATSSAVETVRV